MVAKGATNEIKFDIDGNILRISDRFLEVNRMSTSRIGHQVLLSNTNITSYVSSEKIFAVNIPVEDD